MPVRSDSTWTLPPEVAQVRDDEPGPNASEERTEDDPYYHGYEAELVVMGGPVLLPMLLLLLREPRVAGIDEDPEEEPYPKPYRQGDEGRPVQPDIYRASAP